MSADHVNDKGHEDAKVDSNLVSDEGHDDGEVGDDPEADDEAVEDDDGVLGARSQPEKVGECIGECQAALLGTSLM